jgi:non-ribosomal peptide synthetase-like protein
MESIPPLLAAMAAIAEGRDWPGTVRLGFILGAVLLVLLPCLMIAPSAALVAMITIRAGLAWGVAATFLAGPLFVFMTCTLVLIGKRVVMPRGSAGIYPVRSWFGLRKWLSDQIMAMSLGLTNSLYATLYLVPFLRLLGARVGIWSEVSTVAHVDPDMLLIGSGSFVADNAVVGSAVFHRGCVALAPAEIGQRSFVGNGAIVLGSSHLGANSLIGVHSVAPTKIEPETSWLGSPAIFLPRRQASEHFGEEVTYCPSKSLIACRLAIEFFRVTLPATILELAFLSEGSITLRLAAVLPPLALLMLMPLLIIGIGVASTLIVVLLKWLIVGRYRPRVEPLWSVFVWRSELITGLYESLAVSSLLTWLTGTPWIALFLRLFGTRIGRRVWLDTTYLTELDLVEIGDDAAVGVNTSLQTHLFEDRVMKMSTVKIGAGSSIGSRSVILYDAEVGAGASLDALSLVMKGETLPKESSWRGIPARASGGTSGCGGGI